MMENKDNLQMIPCIACKEPMPELRLLKFGYKVCVNCSTVEAKRGVPVMFGSKDHTWTDIVVMEEKEYQKYESQNKSKNRGFDKLAD